LIELSYTLDPSKSTGEKADAILGQMRREQAVKDLVKSNRRMGLKPLDVSEVATTTTTTVNKTTNNRPRPRPKKSLNEIS
jgi:hypothetical protein